MASEKKYFSYNQIHEAIRSAVVNQKLFENFRPTLIVSIGTISFMRLLLHD
jgi:hypothetical protein